MHKRFCPFFSRPGQSLQTFGHGFLLLSQLLFVIISLPNPFQPAPPLQVPFMGRYLLHSGAQRHTGGQGVVQFACDAQMRSREYACYDTPPPPQTCRMSHTRTLTHTHTHTLDVLGSVGCSWSLFALSVMCP
jgi:hypothetical protein